MELGERIKSRRIELGLSQEDLAEMIGYKSRSAIGKIETNANGITQSKIVAFAKALKCTPSYLMGWETEEDTLADRLSEARRLLHDNKIHLYYLQFLQEDVPEKITTDIPEDKFILIGNGKVRELTQAQYTALQSVLEAMSNE